MGLPAAVVAVEHNLGMTLARRGRLEEAIRIERGVADVYAVQGNVRMEGVTRIYLAAALHDSGDFDAAEPEARRGAALLGPVPPVRAYALAVLARARGALGRATEALETAREAISLLDSLGVRDEGDGLVRLAFAEALDAAGDRDGARRAVAAARDVL